MFHVWMKQEVKKRVQPLTSCFLQCVPNFAQNMADEVFGSRHGPSLFSTCCLSLMGYLCRGSALTASILFTLVVFAPVVLACEASCTPASTRPPPGHTLLQRSRDPLPPGRNTVMRQKNKNLLIT